MQPLYTRKARLIGGEALLASAGATLDEIGTFAECHVNTVSDALRGRAKLYVKAHQIFTALNMRLFNSARRSAHVEYQTAGTFQTDPTLEDCLVFYGLERHMKASRLSVPTLASEVGVQPVLVENARRQWPVDKDVVSAIRDALEKRGSEIDPLHIVN
ncbi:hypothetical protein [Devosia sp. Root413D1]|uniref:hypothetical protein n=1 Tax=Devosia sp. Root413D1 TaxID=1736531 RepID=UPI0012E3C01B|nr:hypothetical protein [Devosia sp. Root413D1]